MVTSDWSRIIAQSPKISGGYPSISHRASQDPQVRPWWTRGGAPITIFDNDLFLGARLALNDAQDTSALIGTVVDLENGSSSFRIEAERRIGQSWKVELEGQVFVKIDTFDPIRAFSQDSFATLRLSFFY